DGIRDFHVTGVQTCALPICMLGGGADCVIGVDPNWLFLFQFQTMARYLPERPAWHLPFALEELPANLQGFDTVFSMGVLHHRRSDRKSVAEGKSVGVGARSS